MCERVAQKLTKVRVKKLRAKVLHVESCGRERVLRSRAVSG